MCDHTLCKTKSDNSSNKKKSDLRFVDVILNDLPLIENISNSDQSNNPVPHKYKLCLPCLYLISISIKMQKCHKCETDMLDYGLQLRSGKYICRFCLSDDVIQKTYQQLNIHCPGWKSLVNHSRPKYPTTSTAIVNDYMFMKIKGGSESKFISKESKEKPLKSKKCDKKERTNTTTSVSLKVIPSSSAAKTWVSGLIHKRPNAGTF